MYCTIHISLSYAPYLHIIHICLYFSLENRVSGINAENSILAITEEEKSHRMH